MNTNLRWNATPKFWIVYVSHLKYIITINNMILVLNDFIWFFCSFSHERERKKIYFILTKVRLCNISFVEKSTFLLPRKNTKNSYKINKRQYHVSNCDNMLQIKNFCRLIKLNFGVTFHLNLLGPVFFPFFSSFLPFFQRVTAIDVRISI